MKSLTSRMLEDMFFSFLVHGSLLEFGTKKNDSVSCQVHASFQCTSQRGGPSPWGRHQARLRPQGAPDLGAGNTVYSNSKMSHIGPRWCGNRCIPIKKDQSGGLGEIIFMSSGPFIYPFLIQHIFRFKHMSKSFTHINPLELIRSLWEDAHRHH